MLDIVMGTVYSIVIFKECLPRDQAHDRIYHFFPPHRFFKHFTTNFNSVLSLSKGPNFDLLEYWRVYVTIFVVI
jgi:hypothetical protein